MGRYVKRFDLFEKINPKEFFDHREDPEDEEDDEFDELSDELIGGDVYRGVLSFLLLDPKSGELREIKFQTFNQYVTNYGWRSSGYRWPYTGKYLFDVNLIVEKLSVVGKTKTGSLQIVGDDKKRRYSISPKNLFKGDKLSNYYVRPNDVLAFDRESLSEGLQFLYQKYIKLFKYAYTQALSKEMVEKKVEDSKKKIVDLKQKLKDIEFVLDNMDNIKSYLSERVVKRDKTTFEKAVEIAEKNIKEFSDIEVKDIENHVLKKLKDLG